MKTIILALLLASSLTSIGQNDHYLIAGTYTSGSSEGIYVYKFNSDSGTFTPVSSIKSSNPSFLAISPDQRFIYAINENADSSLLNGGGSVSSFSFNKQNGQLSLINQQPSGGKHPCYVSIDKKGRWLFAGNYSSGSLSLLKVKKDGSLDFPKQIIEHSGYSVNAERQTAPHVHATVVSPDNKFLLVPDLGIDKLMIYSFNAKKGKLSAAKIPFHLTEPGAGPRHVDFHPYGQYAYLIEELTGSISVYAYYKGALTLLQNISSLPGDYNGAAGSADIHVSPDGKFLYASNRGESNTIAIFSINPANGQLFPIGHQSTLGKTPRNFNFDPSGKFLLVANQNSDEIVIFKRDLQTGLLTDTNKRIKLSKPVCIKWISAN